RSSGGGRERRRGEVAGKVDDELRPVRARLQKLQPAAMAADKLGRDGKAETGTALADIALERLEKMVARTLRQAGSGVAHPDPPPGLFLARPDLDGARALRRLDRLPGVAHEVRQDPMQLFLIEIGRASCR